MVCQPWLTVWDGAISLLRLLVFSLCASSGFSGVAMPSNRNSMLNDSKKFLNNHHYVKYITSPVEISCQPLQPYSRCYCLPQLGTGLGTLTLASLTTPTSLK
jgi:hypothetical protein